MGVGNLPAIKNSPLGKEKKKGQHTEIKCLVGVGSKGKFYFKKKGGVKKKKNKKRRQKGKKNGTGIAQDHIPTPFCHWET
jgi:hypothetical protein